MVHTNTLHMMFQVKSNLSETSQSDHGLRHFIFNKLNNIRDGLFDIRGGGVWAFLEKILYFTTGAKKINCLQPS